ncbi:MAG: beta-ketoacyl synthase, partial [Bacteroidales bacterium]|nr:beta-ketoacyl synthase [Bacteroidales bacterium]
MGGKRMIVKVSDNIISPLGTTSAENYAKVKAGLSALRRYDGLWGLPEPFFASLLDRNAYADDRQTIDEKIVIYSISKALEGTEIDTTWTRVLFIISTTKGNVFLLDER